jgi:Bacterial Ig-like domain (group 3)
MKGPKLKWPSTGRLSRTVLMLSLAGATAGATLLTAAVAQAGTGSEPGHLSLNPASGATTLTPTWSTTDGCPAGFQTSAVLAALNSDGSFGSYISPTVANPTSAFSGTLQGDIANLISLSTNVTNGGTSEFAVYCFSGPGGTGSSEPVQSTFVTLSANGSQYTTAGAQAGPVATTTTLAATPNPAAVAATVTLTATVTAADSSSPVGSVQFEVGGTNIGSPVAVSGGTASTTTTFAAAGSQSLSAVFTPTSATAYGASTGTFTEGVGTQAASGSPEPVTVTVPATGTLSVAVNPGTVALAVTGLNGTGTLQDVTVTDSRNTYPGWSVSGQESVFTGSGSAAGATMSGDQLGWVPTVVGSLQGGAVLGPTVAPAAPGIGTTAGLLAKAAAGQGVGTNVLSANLNLLIPAVQKAGPYTGSLAITYVATGS